MAEIILINPRFDPTYWGLDYALPFFRKSALLPPLNLSLLAGLTPPEHSVSILDENVEEIDYERCRRADIVGLTGMVVQRQRMSDIIVVFGRRPRVKTVAQVIAEMEGLVAAGIHDAFIVDDNLIGNKKAIKTILREMIGWQEARGYPLSFITEASIDLAEDEELMQLMVKANIDTVFVGIESPNEDALRETKKIEKLTDRSVTALEKLHRNQE